MSDNNGQGKGARPPRTLKGLLKFCMESTQGEDPTDTSAYESMSTERKEWLDEALRSMTVNTAQRVGECLQKIQAAEVNTEEGTEQIITSLEELQDWVEDLDIAEDFITLQGLRVMPSLMGSEVSEIRWRTMELLANLCQNNPKVQATVLASHFLPPILLLIEEDDNPTVRVKAMYALSCLSRSHHTVQMELFAKGGLNVVVKALSSDQEKLRMKAAFMLFSLSQDNPALRDALLDKDLVEPMIESLKGEHCISHEHLMNAFVSLCDGHLRFKSFCLQDKFDLKSFLTQSIKDLEGKEEFEDERTNAQKLLTVLNSPTVASVPTSAAKALALMPA